MKREDLSPAAAELLCLVQNNPYIEKPLLKYVQYLAETKETPLEESEAYKTFVREANAARMQQADS